VYEIVALSARPKPARELGGARSARPSGGIFVNRTEALRFAMFENGNRPQGVLMIPGVFELDMRGRQVSAAAQRRMGSQATGRV